MQTTSTHTEIARHLNAVVRGNFEIRTIGNGQVHSAVFAKEEIDKAVRMIPTEGLDVYLLTNPTKRLPSGVFRTGSASKDRDIREINTIAIDIDAPREDTSQAATDEEREKASDALYQIEEYLNRFGFYASARVSTGNGYALWYSLKNSISPSQLKALINGLHQNFPEVDRACSNPSRVMRLAGTINQKAGRTAKFLHGTSGQNDVSIWPVLSDLSTHVAGDQDDEAPEPLGLNVSDVKELLLSMWDADPCWCDVRENWLRIAGALKHEGGDNPDRFFEAFNVYASRHRGYVSPEDCKYHWDSLNRSDAHVATVATICGEFEAQGVTFSFRSSDPTEDFAEFLQSDEEDLGNFDMPDKPDVTESLTDVLAGWSYKHKPVTFAPKSFPDFQLAPGRIMGVGGEPGAGKTTFVLQALFELLIERPELKATMVEVEMAGSELINRVMAMRAGVDADQLANRTLDLDETRPRLIEAKKELQAIGGRLQFVKAPYNALRLASAVGSHKPDIVVIDYLQRLSPKKKSLDSRESIDNIMADLRELAEMHNPAILAVAAVSRAGSGLSAFRGSSEIEYGVDSAWMMKVQKSDDKKSAVVNMDGSRYLTLEQLKNRYGRLKTYQLKVGPTLVATEAGLDFDDFDNDDLDEVL